LLKRRREKRKMNKKLSKRLIVPVIAMLLASTFAMFTVQAYPGPIIYLSDLYGHSYPTPEVKYAWDTSTVPVKFNVTVWVTNVSKLMMFQVYITFNDDYINITQFWANPDEPIVPPYVTNRTDAVRTWPNDDLGGRAWDPRYVFYGGAGGSIGNPTYYHLGAGSGAVKVGDTLGGDKTRDPTQAYKLACIEFTVKKMPGKSETLSCTLGINNVDTYMNTFAGAIPNITKLDGTYELAWKEPPKPHCEVSPPSTVFEKWYPAVGKYFDIQLIIKGYHEAWGLTNATCTINFNTTLIDALGAPAANITLGPLWNPANASITVTHGVPDKIQFIVYPLGTIPSGNILVATITFTVKHQNTYPAPDESTNIAYEECILWDHTRQIPTDPSVKGTVKIEAFMALPLPWFEVSPALVELGPEPAVGQEFTVNVKIVALHEAWHLIAVQFGLKYDDTLLEVVNCTEGPFMKNPAWNIHGTFFVCFPAEADPHVLVGDMLLPTAGGIYDQTHWPQGTGVLVTIRFKALKQDLEPCYWTGGSLSCELGLVSLFGQWAIDANGNYIPAREENNVDGTYRILNTPSTGRHIDLYGGANNGGLWAGYPDPFPAPYGGQGPEMPMDLVIPQSEVTFYTVVEYNCWPVQSKDVGFEIEGPYIKVVTIDPETQEEIISYEPAQSYKIWAKLTTRTDSNGIAVLTFRMPWPCEDPESITGIWLVTATVNLADEIIVDTMMYYYEHMVYITKVTTDKYYYYHDVTVKVCVTYQTHSMQYYPALFSVVITDELGVPFGFATYETEVGGAEWCTWIEGRFCVDIYIPKYAFAGLASVHVSVYDKDPTEGGFSYGEEYAPLPKIYILPIAPPTVYIKPSSAKMNQTAGEFVTFEAMVSGGWAPYTYQWYGDGYALGTSKTQSIYSWSPGTHLIKVVVTDFSGYTGTAFATLIVVI
jgi:hypothetical protein